LLVFCTQCGHENPPENRFCANCGAPLRPSLPGQSAGERPSETTSTIAIPPSLGRPGPGEDGFDPGSDAAAAYAELESDDQAAVDGLPTGCALLVVVRGPSAGSRYLLDTETVTAGRHPDSDIFLDDVTVSRRHAEFRRQSDGFSVHDVGSLNGTYVNRDRIDAVTLSDGDEVQIGKFRLVYFASRDGGR
jgi:hypothetical protein